MENLNKKSWINRVLSFVLIVEKQLAKNEN